MRASLFSFTFICTALMMGCQSAPQHTQQTKAVVVPVHAVSAEGIGQAIGTVTFSDSDQGLVIQPNLSQLPAGTRGFHIHQNPSCAPDIKDGKATAALKAGGHFDPHLTQAHKGPTGDGHLGDIPFLTVQEDGTATTAVIAPRLNLELIQNKSIMVHAGGDNYSDTPEALGGGGARIACGVIQ